MTEMQDLIWGELVELVLQPPTDRKDFDSKVDSAHSLLSTVIKIRKETRKLIRK